MKIISKIKEVGFLFLILEALFKYFKIIKIIKKKLSRISVYDT